MKMNTISLGLTAVSFVFAFPARAITIAELKGDWTPDYPKTVESLTGAYRARLAAAKMSPEKIEARLKEMGGLENQLRTMSDVIGFDDGRAGFLQSNSCLVGDAKFDQIEPDVVLVTVSIPGMKPLRASGNAKALRIVGSGDKDAYVWVKSVGGESALDPKHVAPPTKDAAGLIPEDVVRKVGVSVVAGDEAAAKAFFTDEALAKWYQRGVVAEWNGRRAPWPSVKGSTGSGAKPEALKTLKIESCRRLARVQGDVYSVVARFESEDGKTAGLSFSPYLRQVEGHWKIIAPNSFK